MPEPHAAPARRSRRRLIRVLALIAASVIVLYLIPGGPRYDAAPLVRSLHDSAELGQRELLAGRRGPLPREGGSLLLRNARILDVSGEANGAGAPSGALAIRIRDGRIVAIGPDLVPEGEPVLDLRGASVLPGLVDAHVHLAYAPGAALRGDSAATSLELRRQHLKAHLSWGVTTIFDPAVPADVAIETLAYLSAGNAGPRYLHLGPPLSTPGGYLEDLFPPPIATQAQLDERLDSVQRSGAIGVKLTFEPGMLAPIWKLHPEPMLAAIAKGTRARGLPIYAHALNEPTVRRALDLGVRALVHHMDSPSDDLVRTLASRRIPVITTAVLWDIDRVLIEPWRLDEPRMRLSIPAIERATASDPDSIFRFGTGLFGAMTPQVPPGIRRLLAISMKRGVGHRLNRIVEAPRLQRALASLKRLHEAGVPLVMGTDSGNWPLFPYYFHGPTSHHEIELLLRAGLTPRDVLRICTKNGAELLGLSSEIGEVVVGRRADLLVVEGDPLVDLLGALRSLRYVVRDGTAYTPEEWMR